MTVLSCGTSREEGRMTAPEEHSARTEELLARGRVELGITPPTDSLVDRIRAEFDRLLLLQDQIFEYVEELEAMPDTGLIGPRSVVERLQLIMQGMEP